MRSFFNSQEEIKHVDTSDLLPTKRF